jgi:hypothetical protein
MANPVKEYKEFFLRAAPVGGGSKPDKETGYPVSYVITTPDGQRTVNNRFLKSHFPSEDVFKKFLESIAFLLNPESTGTTEAQGLVRVAIGSNVVDRLDDETVTVGGNPHVFTTVVVPSTLPIVSAAGGSAISVTPRIRRVSDNAIVVSITPGDRLLYYMDYELDVTLPTPPDNIGNSSMLLDLNSATVDQGTLSAFTGTGAGTALQQVTIAANTLVANGDYIEMDLIVRKSDNTNTNSIGGTVGFAFALGASGAVIGYTTGSFGAGINPALVENQNTVGHTTIRIYKTSATTAKVVQQTEYHVNNGLLHKTPSAIEAGYDPSASIFKNANIAGLDWTASTLISLFTNIVPAAMNASEPFTVSSFIKTYKD